MTRLRPLLDDLLTGALADYREAWAYTRAIPRSEIRLRLACAWPMLIGLRTLALIRRADDLLDPDVTVKISRGAVYRILVRSGISAWSNAALGGHYRGLRRPLDDLASRGAHG
jgi:farnesyl-diphosphate farnesyltransferase